MQQTIVKKTKINIPVTMIIQGSIQNYGGLVLKDDRRNRVIIYCVQTVRDNIIVFLLKRIFSIDFTFFVSCSRFKFRQRHPRATVSLVRIHCNYFLTI